MRVSKLSILQQNLLLSILPTISLFILLLSYTVYNRLEEAEENQRLQGANVANHIATASEFALISGNRELLNRLSLKFLEYPITTVEIYDLNSELIAQNSLPWEDWIHLKRYQAEIISPSIPLSDEVLGTQHYTDNRKLGEVVVSLSDAPLIEARNQIITNAAIIGLLSLLFAGGLAWYITRRITQPLNNITDTAKRIADGELEARAKEQGSGEIRILESAINTMAANITQKRDALQNHLEELELAKARAEEASRAKSDFLATMSHELRTPMNGALGMMELLGQTTLDSEQKRYLTIAADSTRHLLSVVNDILDFSRIEQGRLELDNQFLHIGQLLHNASHQFLFEATRRSLNLSTECDPALSSLLIEGDETRLRQIFINLIGNAIKFTSEGGVKSTIQLLDKGVERVTLKISITDSGIGIAKQNQEKIFDSFSQADGSTVRRFGGSGLGLAIVKRLCELMGATITVSSEEGVGSCFEMTLTTRYRYPSHNRDASKPRAQSIPNDYSVLVVEDNPVNQLVIDKMLQRLGATVTTAGNGVEALEQLETATFDLILMDCQMPEMDGLEATQAIRSLEDPTRSQIPIIALTANALEEQKQECLAAGMDDYLTKPVNLDALDRVITQWHDRLPTA